MDPVRRYLAGETCLLPQAVVALRRLGEAAARRAGLQPADADALGVDFAAEILTRRAHTIPAHSPALYHYLWHAAIRLAIREAARLADAERLLASYQPDAHELAHDPWIHWEWRELVRDLQTQLCHQDRELFRMCLLDERGCPEVARLLGCTHGALRKRLERLRARLRTMVHDSGWHIDVTAATNQRCT